MLDLRNIAERRLITVGPHEGDRHAYDFMA